MERSGTLSEPSDNSTTPYIKKETNPFGSASLFCLAAFRGVAGGTGAVDAAAWQGRLAGRGHARFLEALIFNEL